MPRRGTSGSLTSSFWIGSRPVAVFPSSEFSSFPRRESLKSCVFSDQVRWQANQQLRNKAVVEPSRSVVRISILFVCNYKPPPLCILLFPGAGREIECKVPAQKKFTREEILLLEVSPFSVATGGVGISKPFHYHSLPRLWIGGKFLIPPLPLILSTSAPKSSWWTSRWSNLLFVS